jgi:alpha-ketoglutarate-dependent taurine dioxygenase
VTQDAAHPSSISAKVGLDEQPLHTDGAHLRRVPDIVVLWVVDTSDTPTLLWDQPLQAVPPADTTGVFMVRPGGEPFLASAVQGSRLRFDPVCMTPVDAMARRVSAALQSPPEGTVHKIAWDTRGKVLVLRNRRVLHARAAVVKGDANRRVFRSAFYEEA